MDILWTVTLILLKSLEHSPVLEETKTTAEMNIQRSSKLSNKKQVIHEWSSFQTLKFPSSSFKIFTFMNTLW